MPGTHFELRIFRFDRGTGARPSGCRKVEAEGARELLGTPVFQKILQLEGRAPVLLLVAPRGGADEMRPH